MAKGIKTAKALTLEEKLEQALVPVDEQPYSIPENWCWVYTPILFNIEYGKGLPTKQLTEEGYPVFGANGQIGYCDKYMFEEPKALMSCRGAYSGVMNKTLPYSFVTSNSLVMNCHKVDMTPDYICYLFSALDRSKLITGTAQPQVTVQAFSEYPIPMIPVAEQQRIVDRIESIFAKLDEAKEKAQAVVDGFELRKSAILHKAFNGELTEQWRQAHKRSYSDWRIVRFDEAAEIKSNLVAPIDYQDYPHIAPDNIEKKTGVLLEYHTIATDGVKSGKHLFHAGQILYSKIRPYLSKVVVVNFDGLCSADMYPIDAKEDTRYLWYYMLSDEFLEQVSNAGSRSVLPKINQKELSKVMVRMTSLKEQQAVVKILDDIFEKEQHAKEAAESVLARIDTMKKAVLARAFRGELGTNDPAEESAVELLKGILDE